jgi:hypothetical protein
MKRIVVKRIDKKKFDAYILTSRSPKLELFSEEKLWFSNDDETILGTVVLDKTDNDYAAIVLGRDEIGRFRAFNQQVFFVEIDQAIDWIENTIKWYTGLGKKIFPQGDTDGTKTCRLFEIKTDLDRQHPYFIRLNSDDAFLPAKHIIDQLMPHFVDIDGNFVEQFQTTGFDSRVWELYLYSFFIEEEFEIDRRYDRPDFIVNKYGQSIAIEAVTVGRKNSKPKYINLDPEYFRQIEKTKKDRDEMAIRFGSPLYTKLQKEYWNLNQTEDLPIVLAIADFHEDYSMTWSSSYLMNYLYGYDHDWYHDDNGNLIIKPFRIEKHVHNDKEIPSGFFEIPEAENISGILFSASGTISKFNRMGIQAGFKQENIRAIRFGFSHKHDPNASKPDFFQYEVDESSQETWKEGLNLYHNPRAKFPLDPELFPGIAHHFLEESGNVVSYLPDFHPYSSISLHMKIIE